MKAQKCIKMLAVCLCVQTATAGSLDMNKVGFRETGGVDVDAGASVKQADPVILDETAKFLKTGEGTLELPLSKVNQQRPYSIAAIDGTIKVSAGTDATVDATTPPDVCQKAAYWVNTDSVVLDGDSVVRWCDVREPEETRTADGTPAYTYATPAYFNAAEETPPVLTTKDGRAAVFFGGHQAGKYMMWSRNFTKVQTMFFVHGLYNTFGAAIGCKNKPLSGYGAGGVLPVWSSSSTKPFSTLDGYFEVREDLSPDFHSMRCKIDGRVIDVQLEKQRKGFALFEMRFPTKVSAADTFFYETFDQFKEHQGGDYLSEALVFTNLLTEAESLEVQRYLMKKWNLPWNYFAQNGYDAGIVIPKPTGEFGTSAKATVEVTAAEGEVTPSLVFAGEGSVVKKGAGTLVVGQSTDKTFSGNFILEEGDVIARYGALPPVKLSSGASYTAIVWPASSGAPTAEESQTAGLKLTKGTAAAGVAVKDGSGWARANGVADDVRMLKVEDGVLQLEAKSAEPTYVTDGRVRATFFDGDFEKPHNLTYGDMSTPLGSSYTASDGWRQVSGSGGNIANYMRYTEGTQAGQYGTFTYAPPSGSTILRLCGKTLVETKVSFPAAGRYELSFRGRCAWGAFAENASWYGNYYQQVDLRFGKATESAEQFACVLAHNGPFARYRYLLPEVTEAGEYVLQFYLENNAGHQWAGSFWLDDVEAVLVGETDNAVAFRIPNGDMEKHLLRDESPYRYRDICRANLLDGWEFSKLDGTFPSLTSETAAWPAQSVVAANIWPSGDNRRHYAQFNGWDMNRGSGAIIFVSSGGVARTTFVAPAGTYRLRGGACISKLEGKLTGETSGNTSNARIQARLTLADRSEIDLGEISCDCHNMRSEVWPGLIDLAAEQQVTLTLVQVTKSATVVDDLVFVKPAVTAEKNLLADGSFENGPIQSKWTSYNGVTGSSSAILEGDVGQPGIYGYAAPPDGIYVCRLTGNGSGYYQDIRFPAPGRYRVKAYARSRVDGYGWGQGNVSFRIMKKGTSVTNEVLRIAPRDRIPKYAQYVEFSGLFDVGEAGDYRFFVQNVSESYTHQVYVDKVSVTCAPDELQAFEVPPTLKVRVAENAMLRLDFTNTVKVSSLWLGGVPMHGTVNATTNPEHISGLGSFEIEPTSGMMLIVR